MPGSSQSPQQLCHHVLRRHKQQPHLQLLSSSSSSSSSFLPSVFLSAACCAVIFLASAIAGAGMDPLRRLTATDLRTLARGDQLQADGPLSEGKGGPGGMSVKPSRSPQEQRRVRQEVIVNHIKMIILNVTGRDDGPLNGSTNWNRSSGQDGLAPLAPGKDLESEKGASNSVRFEGPSKGGAIPNEQGNSRPKEITNKIKEFADEVPNLIGVDGVVQFVLHPKQTPGHNGSSQRVINATMKVLVRLTEAPLHPPARRPRRRNRRRITIVAYLLDDADPAKAAATDPYLLPIAQLTVLVRKTNWHKVLLPTTIVQRVLDSSDKVLRLRVLCLECNDEAEVVMTPRRSGSRKTGRKSARTGRPGGGEGRRHPVTDRKPVLLAPPVDAESRPMSPVLIVSTKSSSRFRKTD